MRRAFSDDRVEAIAPDREVAVAAALLEGTSFPGDPADRSIFATAQSLDAPLVTRDERMRAFAPHATVW